MYGETKRPYRSFILRCWQAGENGDDTGGEWRYVIEEVLGGEYRQASTSLGSLVAHVHVELERGARECERLKEVQDA